MSSTLLHSSIVALGVAAWFGLLFPLCRPRATASLAEGDWRMPALLLSAFFYVPYAFLVQRGGGTELLEQGLSSSNVLTIGIVAIAAVYLAWCIAGTPRLATLLLDRVLFPFWLFVAIAIASTAWSVVPSYTVYRSLELAVMFGVCLVAFDRTRFSHGFIAVHVVLLVGWLAVHAVEMFEDLAQGIVFSSAKDNMLPLLCVSLILFLALEPRRPRGTWAIVLFAVACFIAAGSAATVAAIPLIVTGLLAASANPAVRRIGAVASATWMLLFTVLLAGLGSFPQLMELVSAILQKPIVELEQATGRGQFWPLFFDATAGHNFGSGFAAGERFIQLLLDPAAVQERMGRPNVFIASAHNMVIGAWVAMGWLGLLAMTACLVLAWREAKRLDVHSRRYVFPMLLVLFANGLTTPGLFGEFNMHTIAWAGVLCLIRSRQTALATAIASGRRPAIAVQAWPRSTGRRPSHAPLA